ncbi:MAG: type II toxin-antitoxin system ParD family antitoxin [Dehalococcoidia bacterium]
MDVSLSAAQAKLIEEMVDSGLYSSPSEAIDTALSLLSERHQKLEALRKDVQEGLTSGEAGPFDEAAVERIITKGHQRLEGHQRPS